MLTSAKGHTQNEHETSHGSMSRTKWAVDGPDGTIEVNGRKFGSSDDGAPMLVSTSTLRPISPTTDVNQSSAQWSAKV